MVAASALICGLALALAPALQLARVWQRRSSDDVSTPWLVVICVGASAWASYGVSRGDPVIVIPNALGSAVALITLLVVLRFRSDRRP